MSAAQRAPGRANLPPRREVAAAVIRDAAGRLLICRRGPGGACAGLFEFPGGKREAGETLEACLRRECREELALEPLVGAEFFSQVQCYPEIEVELHFFACALPAGAQPQARVHRELIWCRPEDLPRYDFCPGDAELIRLLAEGELRAGD